MSPDCSLGERGVGGHGLWHHPIHHAPEVSKVAGLGSGTWAALQGLGGDSGLEQGEKARKGAR